MASEPNAGGSGDESEGVGEEAIRAALAEHGEDVAAAIERTDEVKEIVDLAILTIASADDEEADYVTEALSNLILAVDGLSTDGSVALADAVGENGEELANALETVVALEREGQLDDLVAMAGTLSALELDDGAVSGLDRFAGAVSDAESDAEPVGVLGFLGALRDSDARAGLGYLLSLLRALGRGGRGE